MWKKDNTSMGCHATCNRRSLPRALATRGLDAREGHRVAAKVIVDRPARVAVTCGRTRGAAGRSLRSARWVAQCGREPCVKALHVSHAKGDSNVTAYLSAGHAGNHRRGGGGVNS